MKKKLCYLILVSLMIMIPINAKALTGSVNITCDEENKTSNEVVCKVTGQSDEEVYSISGMINEGSNLPDLNVNFTADSSWQGNGDEGNIQLYTDNGKKGIFNIGTITIKPTNSNYDEISIDLTIDKIKFGDTNGEEFDAISCQKAVLFFKHDKKENTNNDVITTTNSTSTIKNPSTADTKIALVTLGILVAGAFIVIGYKEVKKKNN